MQEQDQWDRFESCPLERGSFALPLASPTAYSGTGDALKGEMRVIQHTSPSPKVVSSLATGKTLSQADLAAHFASQSFFTRNGRVIFGIILALLALSSIAFAYTRSQVKKSAMAPGIIAVGIPDGSTVPVTASMIHITAISMGSAPMAIVNGNLVGEGEFVTVTVSHPLVRVKLKVLRIAPDQIDVTDGQQVLSANLEIPPLKKPARS